MSIEAQESLSDEALAHLKTYKYSSVDKSFISRYILKHYVRWTPFYGLLHSSPCLLTRVENFKWNAFVELLPLWLAPNMVTLLGFMFILINVIFITIFMPDLVGPV